MNRDLNGQKVSLQTGTSLFRGKHLSVLKTKVQGAEGIGIDSNLKLAIKKSLSENEERDNLYQKANLKKQTTVVTIFNQKISFNKSKYYSLIYTGKEEFKDSSGVGAGPNSFKAIEHAFYEFIERQSMMYSFLMERPGENIGNLVRNSKNLYEMIPPDSNYIISDISIVSNVSVILTIICHNGKFAMGLGADSSQFLAAKKALNEAIGYNGQMVDDNVNTMSFMEFSKLKNFPPDAYSQYITQQYSGEKLLETFSFLRLGRNSVVWKNRHYFMLSDIMFASKELDIPINIQFMPTYVKQNFVKVAYIYSPDAYPSINNINMNPEKYKITDFEKKNPVPRRVHAYLPFP